MKYQFGTASAESEILPSFYRNAYCLLLRLVVIGNIIGALQGIRGVEVVAPRQETEGYGVAMTGFLADAFHGG